MISRHRPELPAERCPDCDAAGAILVLLGLDHLVGGEFAVRRCTSCGLAFTAPQLRGEALAARYPTAYFEPWLRPARNNADGPETGPVRPKVGRRTLRKLQARADQLRLTRLLDGPYGPIAALPPGRVLDVGCSTGEIAEAFRKRGWRASGIEPEEAVGRIAASRGIEVVYGTLDDTPWPEQTFDAILFSHTLEHLDSPQTSLQQALRLLKPGGLIGITVPNFASWQRRVFGPHWFPLELPRHLRHFDRSTLESAIVQAGLEPLRFTTSSAVLGVPTAVQLAIFGRCVVGRRLRLAQALFLPLYPLVRAGDLISGGGDQLHLIARRRPGSTELSD
jgi:SAM-dependent methyltransferase